MAEGWGEVLGQFLTLLIQLVIAAGLPVLLYYGREWFLSRVALAESALTESQLETVRLVIRMLVQAAEQSGLINKSLQEGQAKKDWVLVRAQAWLDGIGIAIDVGALSDMVESVVREFNDGKWKKGPSHLPPIGPLDGGPE